MFFDKIFLLVYPPICVVCGKLTKNDSYTCENCLSILQYYRAKEVKIQNEKQFFDKALAIFEYEGVIKKHLLNYKFHSKRYLSSFFAQLLLQQIQKSQLCFDTVIPVPISFCRFFQRGYNQSADIANILAKRLHLLFANNVLIKIKDNQKQSSLQYHERMKNVKDVYQVKKSKTIRNKTILLIDDIYTTGATVNECARVLKQAGATKVIVLTVAYAKKRGKD